MDRLKSVVFLFVLVGSMDSFAQNGLFLSGTFDIAGLGNHCTFQQNGDILAKKWLGTARKDDVGYVLNYELNLDVHFLNHFGVSCNFRLMDKGAVFHDRRFMDANNIQGVDFQGNGGELRADSGNFNPNRNYFCPNLGLTYFFGTGRNASSPFLSYGFGFNQILGHKGHSTMSYFHESSNELLELQLNYKNRFRGQYLEVGYIFYTDYYPEFRNLRPRVTTKHFVCSLALRYTFAGTYMDADYRVTKNNVVEYTDHVAIGGGGYISFGVKVGGGIFGKQIDQLNKKIYDNVQLKKEIIKNQADSLAETNDVRKRDVTMKDEIVVKNPVITISVWDHLKYDKDIISLGLDDKMILENYTLQLSKKTIKLNLNQDINTLVLYAISEGTEKPCTVAILIDDGVTQQQIILNSSMTLSEGLHIRVAK